MRAVTHGRHTEVISTADAKADNSTARSLVSQCSVEAGAGNSNTNKLTYTDIFYRKVSPQRERERERVAARQKLERKLPNLGLPANQRRMVSVRPQTIGTYGFPNNQCRWCTGELKQAASRDFRGERERGVKTASKGTTSTEFSEARPDKAQKINIVHYIGIAADEPLRVERHMPKKDKVMPLVQIGWDEDLCGLEATYMDMLSPTYSGSCRDGCWFCHNQGVDRLRKLRENYPDLWAKLLKLDLDSPVTFHADGHTVHDFDERFALEDEGIIQPGEKFRWQNVEFPQLRWF